MCSQNLGNKTQSMLMGTVWLYNTSMRMHTKRCVLYFRFEIEHWHHTFTRYILTGEDTQGLRLWRKTTRVPNVTAWSFHKKHKLCQWLMRRPWAGGMSGVVGGAWGRGYQPRRFTTAHLRRKGLVRKTVLRGPNYRGLFYASLSERWKITAYRQSNNHISSSLKFSSGKSPTSTDFGFTNAPYFGGHSKYL